MALAQFHSHFWPGDGVGPEPPAPTEAGYAGWQIAVIGTALALCVACALPAPMGVIGSVAPLTPGPRLRTPLERAAKRIAGLLLRLPERVWVLWQVARLLWSQDYERARGAVRSAASISWRDQEVWGAIGRRIGQQAGSGENIYRHMGACDAYGAPGARVAHRRGALLELAWLALKERGR